MTKSKEMMGSPGKMQDFGGIEPRISIFDKNFWKIGGIAGVGYSYGRIGVLVGLVGLGFGFWRQHQLDWYMSNRPVQVYVGERDANGIIRPMFGADRPYVPDQAAIEAFLRQWVINTRWLTPDKTFMRGNLNRAYQSVDDAPKMQLEEYYGINDPGKMVDKGVMRSVEPLGANLISPGTNSYRMDWIEYEIEGTQRKTPVRRTANFVIVHRVPATQDEFHNNPSGLWITHIDGDVFRLPPGTVNP